MKLNTALLIKTNADTQQKQERAQRLLRSKHAATSRLLLSTHNNTKSQPTTTHQPSINLVASASLICALSRAWKLCGLIFRRRISAACRCVLSMERCRLAMMAVIFSWERRARQSAVVCCKGPADSAGGCGGATSTPAETRENTNHCNYCWRLKQSRPSRIEIYLY